MDRGGIGAGSVCRGGEGLRLGTPALTTRGMQGQQMMQVAELLDRVMGSNGNEAVCKQVREEVRALCAEFPTPH